MDAEINVPSAENPELSNAVPFKALDKSGYGVSCFNNAGNFAFVEHCFSGSFNFICFPNLLQTQSDVTVN